jgi:hypothetical protein
MENYPSNSNKTKEEKVEAEPKKVEQITTGEVVRRKKPIYKRIQESFIGGDARSVWGFVVLDVLLPAAKDTLTDAVSQGMERLVFGEVRSTSRRAGGYRPSATYTNYQRFGPSSSVRRDEPRPQISQRARASHDFDEIILATRVEAETVIDRIFDLVAKYEMATVADLYDLVGISGNYTDDKWGWTDIRGAGVTRVRNGYLLDLPRPEPLN